MRINKIEIENFKSFGQEVFDFRDVNVLIGANASGKSNFIQIFEFLKEIQKGDGIQKAVTNLGGIGDIINFNVNKKRASLKIEINPKPVTVKEAFELKNKRLVKNTDKIIYELKLRDIGRNHFEFKEDLTFYQYFSINEFEDDEIGKEIQKHSKLFEYGISKDYNGSFKFSEPKNSIENWLVIEGDEQTEFQLEFLTPFNLKIIEELNDRYIKRSIIEYGVSLIPSDLFDFGIYDINSKVLKETTNNSYETELSKTGNNLPIIVKNILESDNAEQFIADVAGILDFIEDIKVVPFESLLDLRIKERYNKQETKSRLISDGTVSAIAFIVALYYQDNSIVFLEEPEHCLHPSLIDDVIRAAYDVAEFLDKQIIITTHSPDLLRHLKNLNDDLEDLTMISRDEESGNSILEKPVEKEMVKLFLEAELGIDELFIQNLLED
jgi:predicted ATPase